MGSSWDSDSEGDFLVWSAQITVRCLCWSHPWPLEAGRFCYFQTSWTSGSLSWLGFGASWGLVVLCLQDCSPLESLDSQSLSPSYLLQYKIPISCKSQGTSPNIPWPLLKSPPAQPLQEKLSYTLAEPRLQKMKDATGRCVVFWQLLPVTQLISQQIILPHLKNSF